MSTHYIKLKDDARIDNYEQKDEIIDLELGTPEERFPFDDVIKSKIEIYFEGSYQDCLTKMNSIDGKTRRLFEIEAF